MLTSATFDPIAELPAAALPAAGMGTVSMWLSGVRSQGMGIRSQAQRGCAFWEREPGADDDLSANGTFGTPLVRTTGG